jgi:DNA-binding LytR/AlgR family response regulator
LSQKALRTVIIEDEAVARHQNELLVEKAPGLELAGSFADPLEAIAYLKSQPADLLLLDLQLDGLNGFELLRTLTAPPPVIVITADPTQALEAFAYEVVDYLVKPVDLARFLQAVKRVEERNRTLLPPAIALEPHLFIRQKRQYTRFGLNEILWVEAKGDNTVIFFEDGKRVTVGVRIKQVEQKLENTFVQRVHRSYLVNLNKINKLDDQSLIVQQKFIPVSKQYWNQLKTRLELL